MKRFCNKDKPTQWVKRKGRNFITQRSAKQKLYEESKPCTSRFRLKPSKLDVKTSIVNKSEKIRSFLKTKQLQVEKKIK